MAIGLLVESPGGTQEQYDIALQVLDLGGEAPPGQIFHIAGPTDEGWRVVDLWESREAFDRFFEEKLGAALKAAEMPEPKLSFWPIHNVLTG